jgi:hypothetical protein
VRCKSGSGCRLERAGERCTETSRIIDHSGWRAEIDRHIGASRLRFQVDDSPVNTRWPRRLGGRRARIGRVAPLVVAFAFSQAVPALAQLDETCTVSALNRTAPVQADGTWTLTIRIRTATA